MNGMSMNIRIRLSVMMFLQYMMLAVWSVPLAAYLTNELKLEGFEGGPAMRRYLAGAAIMGFGGMLAGGCAVGAGITGGSVFSLTAWAALSGMWIGAGITDTLLDRESDPQPSLSWPKAQDV